LELEDLKQELRDVKISEEKKCQDMIATIDQLMANVHKYDATIADM
jgi:hypothetical protein